MRHAYLKPKARQDLRELSEYIAQDSMDSALRFLDATEEAFALLLEMPEIGAAYEALTPEVTGVRRWHISGFPNHVIFYRPTATGIDILRILHTARDLDQIAIEDE